MKTSDQDMLLDKALDVIQDLTFDDPSDLCMLVIENEVDYCANNCTCYGDAMPKRCIMKALKYYRRDGDDV